MEVPFFPLRSEAGGGGEGAAAAGDDEAVGTGYMCTRSTDQEVLDNRGHRAKYTEALVRDISSPPAPQLIDNTHRPPVRAQAVQHFAFIPRC